MLERHGFERMLYQYSVISNRTAQGGKNELENDSRCNSLDSDGHLRLSEHGSGQRRFSDLEFAGLAGHYLPVYLPDWRGSWLALEIRYPAPLIAGYWPSLPKTRLLVDQEQGRYAAPGHPQSASPRNNRRAVKGERNGYCIAGIGYPRTTYPADETY